LIPAHAHRRTVQFLAEILPAKNGMRKRGWITSGQGTTQRRRGGSHLQILETLVLPMLIRKAGMHTLMPETTHLNILIQMVWHIKYAMGLYCRDDRSDEWFEANIWNNPIYKHMGKWDYKSYSAIIGTEQNGVVISGDSVFTYQHIYEDGAIAYDGFQTAMYIDAAIGLAKVGANAITASIAANSSEMISAGELTLGDANLLHSNYTKLTHAGRALQKHPNVIGLPKGTNIVGELGGSSNTNMVALEALEYIMKNGGKLTRDVVREGRTVQIIEYKLPNGIGARFIAGSMHFEGFLGQGLKW
jgi:hypothetical protein